jgi:hypothetical protein
VVPLALVALLIALAMYQARRDVDIMKIQREAGIMMIVR